jgi:hypothetical protein
LAIQTISPRLMKTSAPRSAPVADRYSDNWRAY